MTFGYTEWSVSQTKEKSEKKKKNWKLAAKARDILFCFWIR